MEDELVVIFGSEIEIEAIMCRELLQSAAIGVIERRNRFNAEIIGLASPLSGGPSYELLVRRSDAEHAAQLVQRFMAETAPDFQENETRHEDE